MSSSKKLSLLGKSNNIIANKETNQFSYENNTIIYSCRICSIKRHDSIIQPNPILISVCNLTDSKKHLNKSTHYLKEHIIECRLNELFNHDHVLKNKNMFYENEADFVYCQQIQILLYVVSMNDLIFDTCVMATYDVLQQMAIKGIINQNEFKIEFDCLPIPFTFNYCVNEQVVSEITIIISNESVLNTYIRYMGMPFAPTHLLSCIDGAKKYYSDKLHKLLDVCNK